MEHRRKQSAHFVLEPSIYTYYDFFFFKDDVLCTSQTINVLFCSVKKSGLFGKELKNTARVQTDLQW